MAVNGLSHASSMRTYQLDDPAPANRVSRTAAPPPWGSAAWATDSRLADWSEMQRDWIGAVPFAPSAPVGLQSPQREPEDEPITLLTLGCLVLAALVSGTLVFSLMRVLVG